MNTLVDFLSKASLFTDCSSETLSELSKFCEVVDLGAGQSLFFEGESSKSIYLVKNGTILISKSSSSGDEKLAHIGSGAHLGEMTFLNSDSGVYAKRSASAEASEPTTLIEIPFEGLKTLLDSNDGFAACFYKNIALSLSARIQKTGDDLANLKGLHLRHI